MKYIAQKHPFDCGPVSIFNAIRYYKKNLPYKYLNRIRRLCATNKFNKGTDFDKLVYTIFKIFKVRQYGVCMDIIKEHEYLSILDHLKNNPAIISINCNLFNTHAFFVEKYLAGKKKFIVSNMYRHKRQRCNIRPNKIADYFLIEGLKCSI